MFLRRTGLRPHQSPLPQSTWCAIRFRCFSRLKAEWRTSSRSSPPSRRRAWSSLLLRLLDERGDYRLGVLTCHLGQHHATRMKVGGGAQDARDADA